MAGQIAQIRPLVAGNWKMNGLRASLSEAVAVRDALAASPGLSVVDVMIAPPATLLGAMRDVVQNSAVKLAGQDCHAKTSGAHTGDVSAQMLRDAGADAVIVGHSERRADHGETSADVRAKAEAAQKAGLTAIICIGETQGERAIGLTLSVIARQLSASLLDGCTSANTVVAYEPVWAIGTGLTPTVADVQQVHAAIRQDLVSRFGDDGHAIRILYGGSVKPDNARALMAVPNVNGALVGGASLKAGDFLAILRSYET